MLEKEQTRITLRGDEVEAVQREGKDHRDHVTKQLESIVRKKDFYRRKRLQMTGHLRTIKDYRYEQL